MDIRQAMAWPFEGLLFDIEHSDWWPADWGEWPAPLEERADILRARLAGAPKLIPLYGHRYLPEQPHAVGNPVFSVYQADIIYYGANLDDYLRREAGDRDLPWPSIRHIPFRSSFAEGDPYDADFVTGPPA